MSTSTVGIRQLKSHLSAYVRRVKAGETILITDRGEPVGRLMPVTRSREDILRQLEQTGVLGWSGRKLAEAKAAPPVQGSRTVADFLLEDRD